MFAQDIRNKTVENGLSSIDIDTVAVTAKKTPTQSTSLTALGLLFIRGWKQMKSFEKSMTASFITVNSADDLLVNLLMVQMIVAYT